MTTISYIHGKSFFVGGNLFPSQPGTIDNNNHRAGCLELSLRIVQEVPRV